MLYVKNFALAAFLSFFLCIIPAWPDSPVRTAACLTAAVTIVPEAAFVRAVGGGLVRVITVIPPGYTPAVYEPSPKAAVALSEAALYFAIGVPAEANIMPLLSKSTKVISLSDASSSVYPDLTLCGGRDPHIWLSPKRVAVMVEKTAEELSLADPDNAAAYHANAALYISELNSASERAHTLTAELKQRKFIVYHPAFGYLAEELGLEMYALERGGKEASPLQLGKMADFAMAEGIKVIFYQEETDSGQAHAFAEEIGGRAVALAPLSPNYIANIVKMAAAIAEAAQ